MFPAGQVAGARRQVDMEVLFRKVFPVWAARHPGNQGAACVGEGLPGIAVSVGGIAHGLLHRHTGVGLARLHQFQRPRVVRSVTGQYLHGSDQLRVGIHHNCRLVSVEPFTAALVAVAHLRVMHRHHPVPAHTVPEIHSVISALHVLEQQLPQQLRRRHYLLTLGAILGQLPLRLARQFQQPVRVSPNPGQQGSARPLVRPVYGRFSLDAGDLVPPISLGFGPFPDADSLNLRQSPQQLDDPVGQQIVSVPNRPPAQDVGRVQPPPSCSASSGSPIPGQSAGLDSNTSRTLSCRISWAWNTCNVLLAKGLVLHLNPQRHLPADVEVRSGLGLGVAHLVVGLEQESRGQQLGGTLSRPLSAQ